MSVEQVRPIYVAILGTDTVLAARPVEPIQLTRACRLAGFDFVAPISWGEELIAAFLAERAAARNGKGSFIASICPLARSQLEATPVETPVLHSVAPPVAAARYLRAAFQPRDVHVTYVGSCAGASHPEVDVQCLPQALFRRLAESGIDLEHQPRHLDGELPPERARYASSPGGAPDSNWLLAHIGRRVVEAAPITADVVSQLYRDESVVIDLATACRCVCARDRITVSRQEPPRVLQPVIGDVQVPLTNGDGPHPDARTDQAADLADGKTAARFTELGLSAGDVAPIAPFEHTMTKAIEPW